MATFGTRLLPTSDRRIVLACDYAGDAIPLPTRVIRDIRRLSEHICAIKLNYHLLLPLGTRQISRILDAAHECGLQAIADIKLNDIGNTNRVASGILWDAGFDAVIANPIMGPGSLETLARSAHGRGRGVIALCHMSAPEARASYEMRAYSTPRSKKPRHMHEIFLGWALDSGADGVIVGATFPDIIRDCSRRIRKSGQNMFIMSPGVGAQGADAAATMQAGSDYVIAGRSIILADDPVQAAVSLRKEIAGAA